MIFVIEQSSQHRQGPYRYVKTIHGKDYMTAMYDAIKQALPIVPEGGWMRLVPEGMVERSIYVRGK